MNINISTKYYTEVRIDLILYIVQLLCILKLFKKAKEGHLVDALVLEGDEGRNRLR